MPGRSTTIGAFLEPVIGPDASELDHIVQGDGSSSGESRYHELGEVEVWVAFNRENMASNPTLSGYFSKTFTPSWKPWIADAARIIHNERQLESLFNRTLMSRVEIACNNIGEIPVTILECPGSFESYHPDFINGKTTTILPDSIAILGRYSMHDNEPLDIQELELQGKIVAVGEVKIVRQNKDGDIVAGTQSCSRGDLAQLQHYCVMLRSRFGFIISNKELVIAQFLRKEDETPRHLSQRGLRSHASFGQPNSEMSANPASLDAMSTVQGSDVDEDEGEYEEPLLPTPLPNRIRNREFGQDGPASPKTPSQTKTPGVSLKRKCSGTSPSMSAKLPTLPEDSCRDGIPVESSPPPTTHRGDWSDSLDSLLSTSPAHVGGGLLMLSSTSYAPSDRTHEVGRVLVQSFPVPNSCSKNKTTLPSPSPTTHTVNPIHPAKALFAMLMLATQAGQEGRRLGFSEINF